MDLVERASRDLPNSKIATAAKTEAAKIRMEEFHSAPPGEQVENEIRRATGGHKDGEGRIPTAGEVAVRIGYESEYAFNRAFKRHVGTPPATWRKKTSPAAV